MKVKVKKVTEIVNQLYYGDNLDILQKYIKDESVDLCYIDPPFNSKRNYNQIYNNIGSEDKAQAQAFTDTWTWDKRAEEGFAKITSNDKGIFTTQSIDLIIGLSNVLGKGSLLAYLVSMTLRIAEIYRVLKPTGSFYFHCDPTASHYLKLIIDAIFCSRKGQFQNEIIWHYRRWTGKAQKFQELHDIVFFYTKTDDFTFNVQYTDYTEGSRGRKEQGVLHRFKEGEEPFLVSDGTVDEKGVRDNDVWQIPFIAPSAKERLGYPTQKPEALLEKIIRASSNEGDVVLDAYCGCGTTVAVAERLRRKWIGIDITYQSISLILERLEARISKLIIKDIAITGVPKDFETAVMLANKSDDRTRKEFEKWAILTYSNNKAIINEKKGGDGGIDGIAYMLDRNSKGEQELKKIVFSVKSNKTLSPSVIRDLNSVVEETDGAVMGILLTLYPMPNLVKESKKYGIYKNKLFEKDYPKITVINVAEIMEGKRIDLISPLDVIKKAEAKEKEKSQHKLL